MKEMECASVAYVASLFKTPMLPVKVAPPQTGGSSEAPVAACVRY